MKIFESNFSFFIRSLENARWIVLIQAGFERFITVSDQTVPIEWSLFALSGMRTKPGEKRFAGRSKNRMKPKFISLYDQWRETGSSEILMPPHPCVENKKRQLSRRRFCFQFPYFLAVLPTIS